jgi:hypothetical protein
MLYFFRKVSVPSDNEPKLYSLEIAGHLKPPLGGNRNIAVVGDNELYMGIYRFKLTWGQNRVRGSFGGGSGHTIKL